MRNAYEPVPVLATPNPPVVSATTGLGTGGGAGIAVGDDNGFGDINVFAGPNANAAGSVSLTFPNTPPTLFISAEQSFGAITQATVSKTVTISWTNASFKSPGGKIYNIHYEWATSN
jgi:hypothetical protein